MSNGVFSPLTQATTEVFKLLLDLDVSTSSPIMLDSLEENNNVIGIAIGLTGDLTGTILYRFPQQTMLEMVQIMSGMEMNQIDEFVLSAVGEIANIISGNALMVLSSNQITCDILPPKFLDDATNILQKTKPIMSAKISTSLGEVELNFQIA